MPFQLPQELNGAGRRTIDGEEGTNEGKSNSLTISWDGRVLMYVDSGLWSDDPDDETLNEGYVFTTFDKGDVDVSTGVPNFTNCFGTAFPRFAAIDRDTPYDPNVDYPEQGKGYPDVPGSMGEIGLLNVEFLSANLYPAATNAPGGQNPYPGNLNGTYNPTGAYRIYDAWVTLQDIPKFWDDGQQRWWGHGGTNFFTEYETGGWCTYPNGETAASGMTMKRNGRCKLRIVVQVGTDAVKDQIARVNVLEKWKPFTVSGDDENFDSAPCLTIGLSIPTISTMWADNFEPNLSMDGHLMVAKGSTKLVWNDGPSRVCFYYNPVAFAADGWRGPWEMTAIYSKRNVTLAGLKIRERYPIARRPLKDYDGTPLSASSAFEGGYTWFDPDGRFVIYTCDTGGVGQYHPQTTLKADGGGTSNRAHVSVVGSVTGWQMWRIDHAAVNATRHMFTGWDQDSRTTYQRTSSFGFGPGFWEMLDGAPGLPMRKDGALRLQLVNNQQLRYFELDLSPYQERDYGFYLPMSLMIHLLPGNVREVDLTRTPDLSGNGHFGTVLGGQLPCEYFDLPSNTYASPGANTLRGLYKPAATPQDIHPTWGLADVVVYDPPQVPGTDKYWAPIADWIDGKDLDRDGEPDTTPFDGRGAKRDMDSDICWGRVGEGMFFKHRTVVRVTNPGASAPELHPGTSATGASDALTASLWVRPLQARTATTNLFKHHVRIALQANGTLTAAVTNSGNTEHVISGGSAVNGSWTHVALTWKVTGANSSEMRLFVNGVQVAANTSLAFEQLKLSTGLIQVGCLDTCATVAADAVLLLDEVALKNSALNPPEIANLALLPITEPTWTDQGFPPGPSPFQDKDERVPSGPDAVYDENLANIGADLFHDVQLSSNRRIACASCHVPSQAFTDGRRIAIGLTGLLLRNTPTLYNTRYTTRQFWDARAVNLEDQALDPVFDHDEMGFDEWSDIAGYIQNDPGYSAAFAPWLAQHGGGPVTEAHVRQAIATYERMLTAGNAAGDQFPLSGAIEAGKALFEGKARCSGCHSGPGFTDGRLRVTGTFDNDGHDDGASATGIETKDRARFRGAFKTATLRELTRTGPYFHDGHAATLAEVVDFYDAGGVRTDGEGFDLDDVNHDGVAEETNRRLGLTAAEKSDLVAFLQALTAGTNGSSNGPPGHNGTPVVTIVYPSGPPPWLVPVGGYPQMVVDITDPTDGQSDLDPTMLWTLEVDGGATQYDWSDATYVPITNGYRATITMTGGMHVGDSVRAADHHGRWSAWAVIP